MTAANEAKFDTRYYTLLIVSQTGSYSAAGSVLARTPSAIIQQVHSLENDLGVTFFRREGRRLIPTRECELVTDYVSRINTLCERLDRELDFVKMRLNHLVVGVTSSVEGGVLSRVLANYRGTEPDNLQITVVTDVTDELCAKLENGTVDVAVVDGDIPDNTFNSVILDTDHLVVALPPDSPWLEKKFVTIDELRGERMILRPEGSGTRNLFEANLRRLGKSITDFHVMMEIDNVSTIKKLVAGGYGISILSSRACEKEVSRGQLATIQPCDLDMIRKIHILYRKDFRCDAIIDRIRWLYADIDWNEA